MTDSASIIAAAIEGAALTTWRSGGSETHDAIRLPHVASGGCYGDLSPADMARIESAVLADLAPGRTIVDGGSDEDGEYLILSPAQITVREAGPNGAHVVATLANGADPAAAEAWVRAYLDSIVRDHAEEVGGWYNAGDHVDAMDYDDDLITALECPTYW